MKVLLDASFLIYLIAPTPGMEETFAGFYRDLMKEYEVYTDVLALDEAIFISKKKYKISYKESIDFIDRYVLPYVNVLPIGMKEYLLARRNILKHGLKPSDAIHLAVMESYGLQSIVTEDEDFRNLPVNVIWLESS